MEGQAKESQSAITINYFSMRAAGNGFGGTKSLTPRLLGRRQQSWDMGKGGKEACGQNAAVLG